MKIKLITMAAASAAMALTAPAFAHLG